jgi:hypothetical protein
MSHDLERFKKIYLDEFGEHLSEEDAERKSRALVNLYLAVYRSVVDVIREVPLTENES